MTSSLRTLRRPADLVEARLAPADRLGELERVAARYAVAITPAMAALIETSDPRDPIARQFVPDPAELDVRPDEMDDPIGDDKHSPVEGLVHRYRDRVLLKLVSACAVYCRFCFRREMIGPGKPSVISEEALAAALAYIEGHREIWEVILSGGDPLVLSPRRLAAVMKRLKAIEHVKIVRVHTRVPAVDPARITSALVRAVKASGKTTYVVLHANHARELNAAARAACARIIDAGIPMLAQSVLLKGVNDDVEALGELMRAFVECRIKPYYLHHLDRARGTAHFRTSIAHGRKLMRALRARHSGLCQPAYVIDLSGKGKVPV
jgi:lysine 2,3-aminomutase